MKLTKQISYVRGLFDNLNNTDEVLKDYLIIHKTNNSRRPGLENLLDDNVIQVLRS